LVSIADVQWVLHNAGDPSTLEARVRRDAQEQTLRLTLGEGWRRKGDFSWRVTTWDLRRMGTGGLVLEDLPDTERAALNLDAAQLGLVVRHVGQYGEHAAGKRAGFERGDVILSFDGRTDRMREFELLAHAVQKRTPGQRVAVLVLRDGRRVELELPMQ
jgi:S1-C subfamily serine protease